MKLILTSVTSLIIFGAIFVSCSNSSSNENSELDKIHISATIFPIYDIARQITSENIEVHLLISPGESLHTFSPTPSKKKQIENSKIVFSIGNGIDSWVTEISTNKEKIITVDKNIILKKFNSFSEKHDQINGEYNPHYWLDPMNAKLIAKTISDTFMKLDPTNSEVYNSRSNAFIKELETLHIDLVEISESVHDKSFVTVHDSMPYLANRYNLMYVGSFEPTGAEEPTPQYLQKFTKIIKSKNVRAIFSEPQLSSEVLEPFIKDNNLTLAILDPIGGIGERDSYQKLIYYNVKTIVDVLKDK